MKDTLYQSLPINSQEKKDIDNILLSLALNGKVKAIDSVGFNCYITNIFIENKESIYAVGYFEDLNGDYIGDVWRYDYQSDSWCAEDEDVILQTFYL